MNLGYYVGMLVGWLGCSFYGLDYDFYNYRKRETKGMSIDRLTCQNDRLTELTEFMTVSHSNPFQYR